MIATMSAGVTTFGVLDITHDVFIIDRCYTTFREQVEDFCRCYQRIVRKQRGNNDQGYSVARIFVF